MNRGLSPALLFSQVENTIPYWREISSTPFLAEIAKLETQLKEMPAQQKDGHAAYRATDAYFSLCLAAHYTTVATYVPTDVDDLIRHKLWLAAKPDEIEKMLAITKASIQWDFRTVTARGVEAQNEWMSGHQGEWYSVAMGAYCYCRKQKRDGDSTELFSLLTQEVERELKIFADLQKDKKGLDLLRAATIIAHNLGDFDRVMDMWELDSTDPIRKFYKSGGDITLHGRLNRHFMAAENHRHFALRTPRALRRKHKYLLPLGPFFYSWGETLAKDPDLSLPEILEISRTLVDGYERLLKRTPAIGYLRALAGIANGFPGGHRSFFAELPANFAKILRTDPYQQHIQMPEKDFLAEWEKKAWSV